MNLVLILLHPRLLRDDLQYMIVISGVIVDNALIVL